MNLRDERSFSIAFSIVQILSAIFVSLCLTSAVDLCLYDQSNINLSTISIKMITKKIKKLASIKLL